MVTMLLALGAVLIFALVMILMATMVTTTTWTLTETGEGAGFGTAISVTKTGDGVISATAVTGPANKEILVGWDSDTIQSLIILSDVNCTVYTNAASTGSPDDTKTLVANEPLVWNRDSGITFPFTGGAGGAVTKIFVTNAAAAAGTIKIRGVEDVTP